MKVEGMKVEEDEKRKRKNACECDNRKDKRDKGGVHKREKDWVLFIGLGHMVRNLAFGLGPTGCV